MKRNNITSVTVYCASSTQIDECYFEAARRLGILLAQKEIRIINGAGSMGLMATVSDAALDAGGKVTGVIPSFMVEQGWHHQQLSELRITDTMHERKQLMADLSEGVVALPGGCGTLEELLEIITWKQLGLYIHPIVILNTNGYFDALIKQLDHAVDEHFMRQQHKAIWQVASTPDEAVELLYTTPLWDRSVRKLAAI
ncbi:MAG: TIGR00730 family Rossman fold protein [Bacteroidaceae bacterium]|nr:TIGR00730 family Rossman fold protein [Bacteroidaceae bacterium]